MYSKSNNTYGAVFFPCVFSTAGVHDVNVSLGLGSGNAGRRDSFDRNTSAFSPSMDYARHKWPQYNTLGIYQYFILFFVFIYLLVVWLIQILLCLYHTASQSPLGLASGSLTPPPAMGSASNLQMGLMSSANNANRGLMNAAPGAEAMSKFRASGMYMFIYTK